jgi:hypothetical protein
MIRSMLDTALPHTGCVRNSVTAHLGNASARVGNKSRCAKSCSICFYAPLSHWQLCTFCNDTKLYAQVCNDDAMEHQRYYCLHACRSTGSKIFSGRAAHRVQLWSQHCHPKLYACTMQMRWVMSIHLVPCLKTEGRIAVLAAIAA